MSSDNKAWTKEQFEAELRGMESITTFIILTIR